MVNPNFGCRKMGGKLPPSGILFEGSIFWLTEDDRFLIDPYEKIGKKGGESQTKQQQFFLEVSMVFFQISDTQDLRELPILI